MKYDVIILIMKVKSLLNETGHTVMYVLTVDEPHEC